VTTGATDVRFEDRGELSNRLKGAGSTRAFSRLFSQRREDFFLARFFSGIIFFTDRVAALAAFLTFRTARDMVDDLFFALLAMVISSISIS
jgi:hypothetical protein